MLNEVTTAARLLLRSRAAPVHWIFFVPFVFFVVPLLLFTLCTRCGMPKLDWLILDSTDLTDAGLESVRQLQRLKMLSIDATQVTDAGFEPIAKLAALESL